MALGADMLELDVRLSRDGIPVVIHDASIARTACPRAQKDIGDLTLDEVRTYDFGSWFNEAYSQRGSDVFIGLRLLTLADVINCYRRRVTICIELKDSHRYPGIEEAVLSELGRGGLLGRRAPVVLQSFDQRCLVRLRLLRGELRLVQLFEKTGAELLSNRLAEVSSYADGVTLHHCSIDRELVEAAHAAGLGIGAWTVNEPLEFVRLLDLGVDAIVTDYPGRMRALLAERKAGGSVPSNERGERVWTQGPLVTASELEPNEIRRRGPYRPPHSSWPPQAEWSTVRSRP